MKTFLALLALDHKLAGGDHRPKQNWGGRLNEVVARPSASDLMVEIQIPRPHPR